MRNSILILLSFLWSTSAYCPTPDVLGPCRCDFPVHPLSIIKCYGAGVTDTTIKKLKQLERQSFFSLHIFNTSLNRLEANAFGNAKFIQELFIRNNSRFETINPKLTDLSRFGIKSLKIYNNPSLGSSLFNLAKQSVGASYLYLARNGLSQVPSNFLATPFSEPHQAVNLSLAGNRIQRIGGRAFYSAKLRSIDLTGNPIKKLDPNALLLAPGKEPVTVVLDDCGLDSDRLAMVFQAIDSQHKTGVKLHLNGNKLKRLDRNMVKDFIDGNEGNEIYVDDNPFDCDCRMKWMTSVWSIPRTDRRRFHGVRCGPSRVSIFELPDSYWRNLRCRMSEDGANFV